MKERTSDAMLRALQTRGALIVEEPGNLLNVLKEELIIEEYHIIWIFRSYFTICNTLLQQLLNI